MGRIGHIWMGAIAAALLLAGCGPSLSTQLRQDGMGMVTRGWQAIEAAPETAELDETIDLGRVRVRVVGSKGRFMAGRSEHAAGYANSDGTITVLGKIVRRPDGTRAIVLDQAVLGHELMHLLNYAGGRVMDPHHMTGAGF